MASIQLFRDQNEVRISLLGGDLIIDKGDEGDDKFIVLDVSGSMDGSATSGQHKDPLANRYSKLDLAKHALEIYIANAPNTTRLSLVTFNTYVNTIFTDKLLTKDGKKEALNAIKSLRASDCTALWDGLQTGLGLANKSKNKNASVCILTDGIPTSSPSGGEAKALADYRKSMECNTRVDVIGLGYDINSQVLNGLGNVRHISDGSMVITHFVNYIANDNLISATNCKLRIEILGKPNGVLGFKVLSTYYPIVLLPGHNGYEIDIGLLRAGCIRDLLVTMEDPSDVLTFKLLYTNRHTGIASAAIASTHESAIIDHIKVEEERFRLKGIELLGKASAMARLSVADAKQLVKETVVEMLNSTLPRSSIPFLEDLVGDDSQGGEVAKALQDESAFCKWGQHYIRALTHSHVNQISNNFKDPGAKPYNGRYHATEIERINKVTDALLPPVPSIASAGGARSPISAAAFTQSFNNKDNGCLGGKGQVQLANGTSVRVEQLKKGDVTMNGNEILCVVTSKNVATVIIDNELEITPTHPVKHRTALKEEWIHPYRLLKLASPILPPKTGNTVYNFVGTGPTLVVNGIEVCLLGHKLEGPVISHRFYGKKCVDDLKNHFKEGWAAGLVELTPGNIVYSFDQTEVVAWATF